MSADEILKRDHSNDNYFHVVLFVMLYKVVLTFEYVEGILKCYHYSMKATELVVLSCGAVYYAVQSRCTFCLCE